VTARQHGWTRLPAAVEGVLWMAGSVLCWVINTIMIRPLSHEMPPIQLLFLRCLFGLILMLPIIYKLGLGGLRVRRFDLFLVRAVLMLVSMLTWIYAIKLLPVAEAVSLSFTAPLFATMMAALLLGEAVGIRRWSAVLVGFIGALVILRPGLGVFDPNALIVIVNAATWAAAIILIRMLTRTESPTVLVAYTFILITPMTLVPALFVWTTPNWEAMGFIVLMAAFGVIGHICSTRALAVAETAIVTPVEYLQLPFTAVIAFLLFGEVPSIYVPIGGAIIVAAVLYISHREAVRARTAKETPRVPT
jgi:drug/metabolite transporter (DMT)-like permease